MKGFTEKDRGHLSGSVSPSLGFYRWAGKSHTDCYLLSVSYRSFKVSSPVTMFQTRSDLSIFEAYVTTQCYLPPPPPPPPAFFSQQVGHPTGATPPNQLMTEDPVQASPCSSMLLNVHGSEMAIPHEEVMLNVLRCQLTY